MKANNMISIRGVYDGKHLRLSDKIDIRSPKQVIVTFLDEVEDEFSAHEMSMIAQSSRALDFLENEEEDYSDKDLKVIYK